MDYFLLYFVRYYTPLGIIMFDSISYFLSKTGGLNKWSEIT